MQNLGFYFDLGWHHIIVWDALDHLLFVLVLSVVYLVKDWKKVLILVTAFTLGHAITLILSMLDVVQINDKLVEILIPVTIMVTAVFNLVDKESAQSSLQRNYFLAFFFGLIHGLGYANALRFIIAKDDTIGMSLLGFNLGLEAGQILVVAVILLISFLAVNLAGLKRKWWIWGFSIISIIMSTKMIWDRITS